MKHTKTSPLKSVNWKTVGIDTIYDIIGGILYGIGIYTFASEADFAPGGIAGVALIIHHFFKWVPIGLCQLVINIPVAIICYRMLGRQFFIKSARTMIISTLIIDLVMPLFPTYSENRLLCAIFAGVLSGAGLALVYMRGSSTGGTDFIIMAIRKKLPHMSIGSISLAIDGSVIVLGGIVFKQIEAVLFGIIMTMLSTTIIDKLMYGTNSQRQLMIISNKAKEISDQICKQTERGATLLKGVGAYTGEDKLVIMCLCSKTEMFPVRSIVKSIDPHAMIMISTVDEAYGLGFNPLND